MSELIMSNNKNQPFLSLTHFQAANFRYLRMLCGLSREELSERYAVNARTVKNWESGQFKKFPSKALILLKKMCDDHGISYAESWLLYGMNAVPTVKHLSVKERLPAYAADSEAAAAVDEEEKHIIHELMSFRQSYKNAIDTLVMDDGMTPYFLPGDYVAGVAYPAERVDELLGQPCIVKTKGGETFIRGLRKRKVDEHYTLVCYNHEAMVKDIIMTGVEVESVAPIMRLWRKSPFAELKKK